MKQIVITPGKGDIVEVINASDYDIHHAKIVVGHRYIVDKYYNDHGAVRIFIPHLFTRLEECPTHILRDGSYFIFRIKFINRIRFILKTIFIKKNE